VCDGASIQRGWQVSGFSQLFRDENTMNRFVIAGSLIAALVLSACNSDLASTTGDVLSAAGDSTATTGSSKKDAQLSAAGDVLKAATVSDAELQAYSRQMIAAQDKKAKLAPAGNKYATRLARLTQKHTKEDGLRLNFKVYLVNDINAFATPDGSIRVYSGIMDLMTDDELRSILGHEIGHVKNGHSLQEMRTAYLASAGAKLATAKGGLSAQVLSELGESFVNAQFSQSMESDADAYGITFLKRNKYKLPAAESAMRKLADLDGTAAGGSNSLFSSHPGSKQRADKIHEQISAQ
jgi:putative metalloprotease